MKTTTISLNVYEVGDVIEISGADINLESKRRTIGQSTRAVVVGVQHRIDKLFSYKVIADNGKLFTLKPSEQGNEKYIGHIDLSLLYEGAGDNG